MKSFLRKILSLTFLLGIAFSPVASFAQYQQPLPPLVGHAGEFLQVQGDELNLQWAAGGGGGGVTSLNTLTGAVTLSAGAGISLSPAGNDIEISSTGVSTLTDPTEVWYTNGTGTAPKSDPRFTYNDIGGSFAASGDLGTLNGLFSFYSGSYGGNIDGVFLNYSANGGANGSSLVFSGDATVGLGQPVISGMLVDDGGVNSSSLFVVPTAVGVGSDNGVNVSEISVTAPNGVTFAYDAGGAGLEYTFPRVDGIAGQKLETDGSGNLSWSSTTGTPTLTATRVAFGSGANLMTSSADLTFNDTTNCLRVDGIDICRPTTNSTTIGEGAGNIGTVSGIWNTMIGRQSGAVMTNGASNVFLGYQTGFANTTGGGNTFLGTQAGVANIDGTNNVFIGNTAGFTSATADFNIYIGDSAGYTATGDRNTSIGFASGYAIGAGTNNTFIGYGSGNSTNGQQNVMIGSEAGSLAGGSGSTFIGYLSGQVDQGGDNTFLGWKSGEVNTTGFFNVFLGSLTGNDNVGGGRNLYAGYGAGQNGSADNDNVFLGYAAGEAADGVIQSVIIGSQANQVGATTGDNNVFIGYQAGRNVTSGNSSIMIGSLTGLSVTTASSNIFIGNGADSSFNGSGMLAIGAGAITTASNQAAFGSTATPINDYFFGEGVLSASPSQVTFNISGATGTDIAGADFIFGMSEATGNAIGGNYKIQTSIPGATGTTLQTSGDRQAIIGKYVTLTETTATSFARVGIPTGTVAGGTVLVTVEANDATDFQSRTLEAEWSAVNKAGTITTGLSTPTEAIAVSAGTLTCTLTAVDAGSGNMDFDIDCTSSLTQTVLQANAQILKNFGTGLITAQ